MGSFLRVVSKTNTRKPSAWLFESLGEDGDAVRPAPELYGVMKLNPTIPQSWAVIEIPSGAIALDRAGRPLMRLGQEEAERLASTLTKQIRLLMGRRGRGRKSGMARPGLA